MFHHFHLTRTFFFHYTTKIIILYEYFFLSRSPVVLHPLSIDRSCTKCFLCMQMQCFFLLFFLHFPLSISSNRSFHKQTSHEVLFMPANAMFFFLLFFAPFFFTSSPPTTQDCPALRLRTVPPTLGRPCGVESVFLCGWFNRSRLLQLVL